MHGLQPGRDRDRDGGQTRWVCCVCTSYVRFHYNIRHFPCQRARRRNTIQSVRNGASIHLQDRRPCYLRAISDSRLPREQLMAIPKFHHQPMSWGATQANGEYDSTLLTLAATGAGVWAVIDGHEVTRQGALAIDTETEVGFYVHARVAQWSSG